MTESDLYQMVLSQVSDAVLITNDAGEFTFVCPNIHKIFGYQAADVKAMGTVDRLLGSLPITPQAVRAAGEIANLEWTIRDRDGRPRVLLISVKAVSIAAGTLLYVCRDITQRKQMEDALHESEARFLRIAENVPDVIFRLRLQPEFACDYINKTIETMLGYTPAEIYADPEIIRRVVDPRRQGLTGSDVLWGGAAIGPIALAT